MEQVGVQMYFAIRKFTSGFHCKMDVRVFGWHRWQQRTGAQFRFWKYLRRYHSAADSWKTTEQRADNESRKWLI